MWSLSLALSLRASGLALAAAAASACLVLGWGCRRPGQGGSPERSLVVWEQEDAAVAPYIDSVFAAFRALPGNEDVGITRIHYHTEDLRQQFQTASIAGNPPDLVLGPSDNAGIFSVSGFILPLDGIFDTSLYNKAAMESVVMDGKAWGIPVSNGNHLMFFYNKRLMPKAPETTDELFAACQALARARKQVKYCLAFNLGEPFLLVPWLGAFGGWPIEGRTPTLDTPQMRRAMEFTLDLMYGRKLVPLECDYNCADGLFKEERAACLINGDWALSVYQERFGKDLGVARIPRLSATGRWPTPMVSGKYFMLSSALAGERLELARRLVEFYTNEENQVGQVRALGRLPALARAAGAGVIRRDPALAASMSQLLEGRPMPVVTEMRAVWDAMRPLLGRALNRQLTPAEAAVRMQQDAAAKIAEMNE